MDEIIKILLGGGVPTTGQIFKALKNAAHPIPGHRWKVQVDDTVLPGNPIADPDHTVGEDLQDGIWAKWKVGGSTNATYQAFYNPANKHEKIVVNDAVKEHPDVEATASLHFIHFSMKLFIIIKLTYMEGDVKHKVRFEAQSN